MAAVLVFAEIVVVTGLILVTAALAVVHLVLSLDHAA